MQSYVSSQLEEVIILRAAVIIICGIDGPVAGESQMNLEIIQKHCELLVYKMS